MKDNSTHRHKLEFPPVPLDGLTVSLKTWNDLKYIFELLDDPSIEDDDDRASLSKVIDRAVREWSNLQGLAWLQRRADARYDAECRAEDRARTSKIKRRIRKAKRESEGQPENVKPIDAAWGFKPAK